MILTIWTSNENNENSVWAQKSKGEKLSSSSKMVEYCKYESHGKLGARC
jgi:hypothetical protein